MSWSEAKHLTVAETAKLVRAALKKELPATKFSVRSDSYAGGASIRIRWTDGPSVKRVDMIAKQFEGSKFDGMIDLKTNHTCWLLPDGTAMIARDYGTEGSRGVNAPINHKQPHDDAVLVSFGADYVFTERTASVALARKAQKKVVEFWGGVEYVPELIEQASGGWYFAKPEDAWRIPRPDLSSHKDSWSTQIHRAIEAGQTFQG
jgi:hypothetical protein